MTDTSVDHPDSEDNTNIGKKILYFSMDGLLGRHEEQGELAITKMKIQKDRDAFQHVENKYFIYAKPNRRQHARAAQVKIEPDKMVFYTGHNSCQIFPKGDPGRSYMISTKTEDDKLTELVNILITIRTGEAKGPKV